MRVDMRERLKHLVGSNGLLARCTRAGAVLAIGTFAERGARFVRNIILARLLTPDQFGLMAIVLAVSHLFEALTEVGVRPSIIQNKKGDSEAFLNIAWWFSTFRGLALYLIGVLAAPQVCAFYNEPSLLPLLRVAFLSMVFTGLTSPRFYVLEKRLQFGRFVWLMQGSGLAGTAITLVAALFLRNVWALVIGFVAETAIRFLASFLVCPIRPRFHLDAECRRELFAFARGMAGLPLLTFVVMQADVFVLGKVCTKQELGMYALAVALANMPLMVFSRVAQPLMLPVLSGIQDNKEKLRNIILRTTRVVFTFGIPLTACMIIFSRPMLSLVYGGSYGAMSVAFGLLSVYFLVYMIGAIIVSTYMAIGRPELHRRFVTIRALLVAILIYPAVRWFGAPGAAGALLLCLLFANVIQVRNLGRLLALPLHSYLATATLGVFMAGLIALPAVAVRFFWDGPPAVQLLIGCGLCGSLWAVSAVRLRAVGNPRRLGAPGEVAVSQ